MLRARHARLIQGFDVMQRRKSNKFSHPQEVSSLLRSVYPAPAQYDAARVFAWWAKTIPSRIVDNARPVHIRKGVLMVHVSSSVWAQELHYMRDDLLTRVQLSAPKSKIRELKFKVGPLPNLPASSAPTGRKRTQPIAVRDLPPALGRALSRVTDDELRDTIARAATSAVTREK